MKPPRNPKNLFLTIALLCGALIMALSTAEANHSPPHLPDPISGANPLAGQKDEPKVNTPDTVIKYGFLMSLIRSTQRSPTWSGRQAFEHLPRREQLGFAPRFTLAMGLADYIAELRTFAERYPTLD